MMYPVSGQLRFQWPGNAENGSFPTAFRISGFPPYGEELDWKSGSLSRKGEVR